MEAGAVADARLAGIVLTAPEGGRLHTEARRPVMVLYY
jgi:hypothetical protein